ncbi:GNAT family N-acetyltransferase [Blastococcus sp. BMG 814]|uniref:GNAT family N-acetyltransferase n=1 Tax=Blastococcus carthaginiensis TaxID=3050034 RepID=A0ABT9IB35_9ACTN|nr:GNAT family N-acetyltransferase [Blastococcus carthaginiensis]MDP5182771.1 GNAT family N-acetyltransferase [Blastococcus carthaginiensis]
MDLSAVDLTTETVRTERLVLRPFRPADVEAVHRASQDPETQRWISTIPVPYMREDARRFVEEMAMRERSDGTGLSVVVEAGGELAGTAGLYLRPGRLGPEIGYTVAPWARGNGYAAETAHALAGWALGLGASRVHLFVDVANTVSQVVARRAGFREEGVVRACLDQRDGSRTDAVLFGRLAGD